eukprot:jgi/Mesvir1/24392/Mv11060-RA.1
MSLFGRLFGGGAADVFPYNIGEAYKDSWGHWTHHKGTKKDDNTPVSIFAMHSKIGDARLDVARNGLKRLRTLRHPYIVSFLDGKEVDGEKGAGPTVYIVTEPVQPLSELLASLSLQGQHRDDYFAWGIHQITEAVSFLSNSCKMIHGNVCMASVVVTPNMDWKLHAFDCLAEYTGAPEGVTPETPLPPPDEPLLPYDWVIGAQYKPQELAQRDWAGLRASPPWAIDTWGLGCLIHEIFFGCKLLKTEDLRNVDAIPKALLPDYQRMLAAKAVRRLNPAKFLESSPFFSSKVLDAIRFLENLAIKDTIEKETFFRRLTAILDDMHPDLAANKVLPIIAGALTIGAAPATAFPPLLKIAKRLPEDLVQSKVLPCVLKLFGSNDRAIRVYLLQNLDLFDKLINPKVMDEQVFPDLCTGFDEKEAVVRELTLKAMLRVVPKLTPRNRDNRLLQYLNKLQLDENAGIRANTTILLGNIARHLSETSQKRVLINAFCRGLKDSYPMARVAGLLALTATLQYYTTEEMATRLLPSVSVLCIDPDGEVRAKSFACIEAVLAVLRDASELRARGLDPAASPSKALPPSSASGKLLGWASSLTSRFGGGDGAEGAGASVLGAATSCSSSGGRKGENGAAAGGDAPSGAAGSKGGSAGIREGENASQKPTGGVAQVGAPGGGNAGDGWEDDAGADWDHGGGADTRKGGRGGGSLDGKGAGDGGEDVDEGDGWGDMDDLDLEPMEAKPKVAAPARPAESAGPAKPVVAAKKPLVLSKGASAAAAGSAAPNGGCGAAGPASRGGVAGANLAPRGGGGAAAGNGWGEISPDDAWGGAKEATAMARPNSATRAPSGGAAAATGGAVAGGAGASAPTVAAARPKSAAVGGGVSRVPNANASVAELGKDLVTDDLEAALLSDAQRARAAKPAAAKPKLGAKRIVKQEGVS